MLTMENIWQLLIGSSAVGGIVGKTISPQPLTIASSAIGLARSEPTILRRIITWSPVLLFPLCLLAGLMSTPVLSWLISSILGRAPTVESWLVDPVAGSANHRDAPSI